MDIFREEIDYNYLLSLFKMYLSKEPVQRHGRVLANYSEQVDLVAYCLMTNHYHLLVYLKEGDGLQKLMQSVMTAYSMYFNRKYKRVGGLFESRFLASRITSDVYLWHVSRYIHLNPTDIKQDYMTYPYSSMGYFTGEKHAEWLHPEWLVETQDDRRRYRESLADDEDWHELYHRLRHELANPE